MNKIKIAATASLFLTAAIWGLSYSAQAKAMESMPALTFVFLRYVIGSLLVLPALFFRGGRPDRKLICGGIACGFCLAGGEIIQQFGLLYTSAGKAGFLTALYVIMIPLIGVFVNQRSDWKIWTASVLSVAGAYLLCSDGTLKNFGNLGDALMVICALFFAFQFIAIAKFAPTADTLQLAAVQFITVAVISGIATPLSGEKCSWEGVTAGILPLLYCGVVAIGFACTLQVVAQKYLHPATVSIILSTASVFAVIWGWWLLNEHYSPMNLIGCAIIFAAVVLVQLPSRSEGAVPPPAV